MNKQRRTKLAELRDRMSELQGEASNLMTDIQDVLNEEQDYLDNMPESLQEGDKGQKAQAAIDLMENIISGITEFTDLDTGDLDAAAE